MKNISKWVVLFLPVAAMIFNRDVFDVRIPVFGRTSFFMIVFFLSTPLFFIRLLKNYKMRVEKIAFQVIVSVMCLAGAILLSAMVNSLTGDILNYSSALNSFISYSIFFLVLFFTVKTVNELDIVDEYYRTWMIILLIINLIGFAQILAIQKVPFFEARFKWENMRLGSGRIASTFRWQGMLVAFLGLMLPTIASNIIAAKSKRWRIYYIANYILSVAVLFFTGSRTSLLVLPLSVAPILIALKDRRAIKPVVASILGISVLTVYLIRSDYNAILRAFGIRSAGDRFIEIMVYGGTKGRQWIWTEAIRLWGTSPIFGIGPTQLYEYIGMHPHSSYIQVLTEEGILGFLVFLVFMVVLTRLCFKLWKMKTPDTSINLKSKGLALGLINFMLYQFTASAIDYHFVYLFIALCMVFYEKHSVIREKIGYNK